MEPFSAAGPHEKEQSLNIAPSLDLTTVSSKNSDPVDLNTLWLSACAIVLAGAATFVAAALVLLINLFTHLAFYQEWRWDEVSPAHNSLGAWVILLPIIGGIVIGYMARYGSSAIRGHGIPEAMERILEHKSIIPLRMTFLKPLSAAVSIGTGGPFGAEGPIIATGGALGSFVGQIFPFHADERKTLLAAGAAAGMTAIFGSPVAAVLLAIELLLFEYRPRSFLPVAFAAATAAGLRIAFGYTLPAFPMPLLEAPSASAVFASVVFGLIMGLASVLITKSVYALEDMFERLPIHWMWWPAIGGLAVGLIGWVQPRTLGVGYNNIIDILSAKESLSFVVVLVLAKFASWSIALGSGTSGGTLAPLFTFGAGLGFALAKIATVTMPWLNIDPGLAALVGMAAIFAGASRALLTSVVFAFETTRQPLGLLPLLGGCTSSYLVSSLLMRHSIMTLKMERRGVAVPSEYEVHPLKQGKITKFMSRKFIKLSADQTIDACKVWFEAQEPVVRQSHIIVLGEGNKVLGLIHESDISLCPNGGLSLRTVLKTLALTIHEHAGLSEAINLLEKNHSISHLIVIDASEQAVGVLGYRDIYTAPHHQKPIKRTRTFQLPERLVRLKHRQRKQR